MSRGNYHDRIIFNGHDLGDICMCRMQRPIMPPTNVSGEQVGGRHGEVFHRVRMDAYDVPVQLWLRVNDRRKVAELRHELADLLWTDEPAPLVLPDDPSRYHLAIVSGATNLQTITDDLPTCTVNFHVCDPIAYGRERSVTLTGSTAKDVSAGGTWEAAPIIRSTTSGGTWKITNQTTSEYVEVNSDTWGTTVPSNKTLICDMANERVTIDGTDAGVTVASDFFRISDVMSLKVTGASTTTVEWEERWL